MIDIMFLLLGIGALLAISNISDSLRDIAKSTSLIESALLSKRLEEKQERLKKGRPKPWVKGEGEGEDGDD